MEIEIKKKLARYWFALLQDLICFEIEKLEKEFSKKKKKTPTKFKCQKWLRSDKNDEGGGKFKILRNGLIFEKVGVNYSEVYGKFNKFFKKKNTGTKKS